MCFLKWNTQSIHQSHQLPGARQQPEQIGSIAPVSEKTNITGDGIQPMDELIDKCLFFFASKS
jgi:hypothetical protein